MQDLKAKLVSCKYYKINHLYFDSSVLILSVLNYLRRKRKKELADFFPNSYKPKEVAFGSFGTKRDVF